MTDALGPWPTGINNRLPANKLPAGALRNVVNADIDHGGNVQRRNGYARVYAGVNLRDAFACDEGVFFVEANTIKRLNANNTASTVSSGWVGPVCYDEFNGAVYVSDGARIAKIVNGAEVAFSGVPPCSILAHFHGRIYGAVGSVIWYTDPFVETTAESGRNFIQVAGDVTMLAPVPSGLFVGTMEKVYFYRGGGPEDFAPSVVLPYGALSGTQQRIPNSSNVVWYSDRGVVVGGADGSVKNIQEENVAPDIGSAGASVFREENGIKQFITSVQNPSLSKAAARDWMDMEIVRRTP